MIDTFIYPTQLFDFKLSAFYRSAAEERLFLFIKLNLTSQEAAAMLGISVDGVKKPITVCVSG